MTILDENQFSDLSFVGNSCAHFVFISSIGYHSSFDDYCSFIINVIKRSFSIKKIRINEIVKNDDNKIINSQYFIDTEFFFYGLDNNNQEKLELMTYENLIELRIYNDSSFELSFRRNIFTNLIYYFQDGLSDDRAFFKYAAQINRSILKSGLMFIESNSKSKIIEWISELPIKINRYGFNERAKLHYIRQK